jgi:Domain of unknown function (DUF4345)
MIERGWKTPSTMEDARGFVIFLRLVAFVVLSVGAMHLVLGLNTENLLGANVSLEVVQNSTLDSQNRFYGVAFMLYGVLLYLSSTNIIRYAPVLRCVAGICFAAGLARFISMGVVGMPPPLILVLLAVELLVPVVILGWLGRIESSSSV